MPLVPTVLLDSDYEIMNSSQNELFETIQGFSDEEKRFVGSYGSFDKDGEWFWQMDVSAPLNKESRMAGFSKDGKVAPGVKFNLSAARDNRHELIKHELISVEYDGAIEPLCSLLSVMEDGFCKESFVNKWIVDNPNDIKTYFMLLGYKDLTQSEKSEFINVYREEFNSLCKLRPELDERKCTIKKIDEWVTNHESEVNALEMIRIEYSDGRIDSIEYYTESDFFFDPLCDLFDLREDGFCDEDVVRAWIVDNPKVAKTYSLLLKYKNLTQSKKREFINVYREEFNSLCKLRPELDEKKCTIKEIDEWVKKHEAEVNPLENLQQKLHKNDELDRKISDIYLNVIPIKGHYKAIGYEFGGQYDQIKAYPAEDISQDPADYDKFSVRVGMYYTDFNPKRPPIPKNIFKPKDERKYFKDPPHAVTIRAGLEYERSFTVTGIRTALTAAATSRAIAAGSSMSAPPSPRAMTRFTGQSQFRSTPANPRSSITRAAAAITSGSVLLTWAIQGCSAGLVASWRRARRSPPATLSPSTRSVNMSPAPYCRAISRNGRCVCSSMGARAMP